jgi:hypothetical protein
MKLYRLMALLAVLVLAVFTGTAAAGGGHDHGGGDRSGGYSGQQQNQSTSAPSDDQSNHSDRNRESKQSDTSASQPATGGDNSHGVKPSNSTKHDTYAKASSDKTKQYGNGQTAGQIATKAGYGDATLHGPGNSQPHKTAACPGGHEVDVHALKHKSGKCESSSQPSSSGVAADVKTKKPCKKGDKSSHQSATDEHKASDTSGVAAVVKTIKTKKPCKKHDTSVAKDEHKASDTSGVAAVATTRTKKPCKKHGEQAAVTPAAPAAVVVSQPAPAAPAAQPASVATPVAAPAPAPVATPAATPAAAPAATPAATPAPTAAAAGASVASAPAPAAATPTAARGVKGAVVALHPTTTKPSGGVLGATTRLGGSVAASQLPFTGLPLWIFALVAAGLIGIGVAFRRASADRI